MNKPLPPQFQDLAPFVADCALESEEARYHWMHSVPFERLQQFHQTMLPRLPAVIEHLREFKLSALPPAEKTLFDLAMTMVETSHPMDLKWGSADFPAAYRWQAIEFRSVGQRSRATLAP